MKIESDDYYRIILSEEYHNAGVAMIEEILSRLPDQKRRDKEEILKVYTIPTYEAVTRCLIGFALAHDEYEFGIGGMSHVIGHAVIMPFKIIEQIMRGIAHPSHKKILKMIEAVESVPNSIP